MLRPFQKIWTMLSSRRQSLAATGTATRSIQRSNKEILIKQIIALHSFECSL
jgi:hypothetical protein